MTEQYEADEPVTCEACGSIDTDTSINFGSYIDPDGRQWSDDTWKCRRCGHRFKALTPWVQNFLVTWEIEIEAANAREAAAEALTIMRDPESLSTTFTVDGESVDPLDTDIR